MRDRPRARWAKIVEHTPDDFWPDALDETVIHDPSGRPWLVCTTDLSLRRQSAAIVYPEDMEPTTADFETQVFYTARAGIRGFPTGHGERFATREEAVAGHREWCMKVRTGVVMPDEAV